MPLNVVEIFRSVQGEGTYMGCPSMFVRLGRCNLACKNCDTKFDVFQATPAQEVADRFLESHLGHLVVTGGEPTLWQDEVAELCSLVKASRPGKKITVETNGAVPMKGRFFLNVDMMSFSPKVGSLGGDQTFKWAVVVENIEQVLARDSRNLQIKYVLDPDVLADFERTKRFHDYLPSSIPDDRVFLQPLDRGTLVNIVARTHPFDPNEYCRDLSKLSEMAEMYFGARFRVVPQMHKLVMAGGGLVEEKNSARMVGERGKTA